LLQLGYNRITSPLIAVVPNGHTDPDCRAEAIAPGVNGVSSQSEFFVTNGPATDGLRSGYATRVKPDKQLGIAKKEVGRHRGAPTHGGVRHEAQALWDCEQGHIAL
jgi:hypothetical protein